MIIIENQQANWPVQSQTLTNIVGIELPIIQAPMAGGPTTPELVAAVSNAGGLGSIGAGYMPAEQLQEAITAVEAQTEYSYGVNLFIPNPADNRPPSPAVLSKLATYAAELGIDPPTLADKPPSNFEAQFEVVIENEIPVFSFTFGIPEPRYIEALKAREIIIVGTATCLREALALQEAGCDAVVAQGSEAGGHRGGFPPDAPNTMIGSLTLIPLLADRLKIPVIASGGIMDGRGILAALILGAAGVQLGTAFLNCNEAGVHPAWREALQSSDPADTDLITTFSGKPARGIVNRFSRDMAPFAGEVGTYPTQNQLTRGIRAAAKAQDKPDLMSLWAGQGLGLSRSMSAAQLMQKLTSEYAEIVSAMRWLAP